MIIYGGGKSGRIHRNVQPLVKVEKPEPEKACNACGEMLPLSAYNKSKNAKDGRHTICRKCSARRAKEKQSRAEKKLDVCGTCAGFVATTKDGKYGACTKRLTDQWAYPMQNRQQAACGFYERMETDDQDMR